MSCDVVDDRGGVSERGRATDIVQAASVFTCDIAADGGVGERGRAAESYRPPPSLLAILPLTVESFSVVAPSAVTMPPPSVPAELPLTVVEPLNIVVPPSSNRPPPSLLCGVAADGG